MRILILNMEIHNKIAYHGTETPMHQDNFISD